MILTGPGRDLRVDFFRGVALWMIFIDHIPDNWIAQWSLRNFALSDATEIFVLLAGYAAGVAYGGSYARNGLLFAGADVLRRVWTLYIAHIFLFVVFSAQVSYSATALDRSDYLDEIHLDVLADAPYRAMLEALLLRFQPAYLNILPMYVVLLAMLAPALPLLRRPLLLAGLSAGLYAATRSYGWNLPSWTAAGWYFNPLAWQFLFIIGAILSQHRATMPRQRWVVDVVAAVILLVGLVLTWVVWPSDTVMERVPRSLTQILLSVDKEGLHPMRLLSILSLAWFTVRLVPPTATWLRGVWARPFVLCGQHSLPVFCVGIFLSFLGRIVMEHRSGGWESQLLVNVVGPALLVLVGALAAWFRLKASRARRVVQPSPAPPARDGLPALTHADNA